MSGSFDFPYFEIQFNKNGKASEPGETQKLLTFLDQQAVTDLIVISHGWNTDMAGARALYACFFAFMHQILVGNNISGIGGRKFAILAVLWPSKKFADQDLIAGGAAGLGATAEDTIEEQLTTLQDLLAKPKSASVFTQMKALIPKLEDSPAARANFVDLVRSVLPPDAGDAENAEDASADFFAFDSEEIMERLRAPTLSAPAVGVDEEGGAADLDVLALEPQGGAAGLGNSGGFVGAAGGLLNYATYYVMKQRAGTVGRVGLNPLLQQIHTHYPALKLHLIGHSFGARLVTAAAMGDGSPSPLKVETMALLQAAFSHYGFAQHFSGTQDGFFRKVVANKVISGPVLITHTKNDLAVGIGYAIASALAQDDAAALGDENDRFGGMGRNGAQKTPEALPGLTLLPVGGSYQFQAAHLHNLQSDDVIMDHNDICKPEIVYAILCAVAKT